MTIAFTSIGCRTNQQEIASLSNAFLSRGYRVVERPEDAAIIICNTCSVTAHTEAKTRRFVRAIARRAPRARILLTGCLAQQKPVELHKSLPVDWIVGNTFKNDIPDIIETHDSGVFHAPLHSATDLSIHPEEIPDVREASRTRFAVKIQEGCDCACAYCIVPALRGPSRSAAPEGILACCERAVRCGYREIVLTGTHIGQYYFADCPGGLVELLGRLLLMPQKDFRIRLSSLDPRDITPELVGFVRDNPRVCRHMHVSFQSLSPDILRAMSRSPECMEAACERISELRKSRPEIALGVDMIVGFPGETESHFAQTLQRASELELAYGHVFRFSSRPNTPAARAGGQVEEAVKTQRSEILRKSIASSRTAFIRRCYGAIERIVVESITPVLGLSGNYLRIEVPHARAARGDWLSVRIERYDSCRNRCIGSAEVSV